MKLGNFSQVDVSGEKEPDRRGLQAGEGPELVWKSGVNGFIEVA